MEYGAQHIRDIDVLAPTVLRLPRCLVHGGLAVGRERDARPARTCVTKGVTPEDGRQARPHLAEVDPERREVFSGARPEEVTQLRGNPLGFHPGGDEHLDRPLPEPGDEGVHQEMLAPDQVVA